MNNEIFKIVGSVLLKDEEFISGIRNVLTEAENTTKQLSQKFQTVGDSLGKIGTGISKAGTFMTATLTTGIGGLVGAGIKYNAQMEEFQMNLTTLLGSSDKATKLLDDLKSMASTTPFETTDLIKATETMIGFGISANDSQKYLNVLGDISMGNSEKLKGLSLAFSQVQSTGRLTGQDLLQMINQGFNPLLYISKMTGKSMATLKEEMGDGAISAEMVADAFEYATQKGQPFYNAMENGAQTVNGRISTLKDNFQILIGNLTESLLPVFEKVVDKLIEITEKFNELTPAQKENVLKWAGIVASIGPVLIILGKITSGVGSVVKTIGVLDGKLHIFTKLNGVITKATGGVGGLKGAFTLLTGPVGIVIGVITALIGAFVYLYKNNEEFRTQMQAIGTQIMSSLKPVFDILVSTIQNLASTVLPVITNAIQTLMPIIAQIITIVAQLVAQIVTMVMPIITQIIEALTPLITMLVETLMPIVTMIIEAVAQIIEALMPLIQMIIETIMPIIEELVSFISEQINMILEIITPIIQTIVGFIQDNMGSIKSVIQSVTNVIKTIIETVMGVIQGIIKVVTGIIKGDWSQVWEGIKQIFTSVWNGIKNVVSNVTNVIKNVISSVWNGIKSVTSKVWDGIMNAIKKPIEKARDLVKGAIDKIKGFFNFKFKWPKLKMPKFGITPKGWKIGDLLEGSIPKLSITWNKEGAIFKQPTIFDTKQGLQGVGEAGPEAVAPISELMKYTRLAVDGSNAELNSKLDTLIEILTQYLPPLLSRQLCLDSGELVGALVDPMDKALAEKAEDRKRGR